MTKILLVDDENEFSSLLAETIERLNNDYSCIICSDIKSAKLKLESEHIDFIITDMNLQSSLNGLDLIRYVNENLPDKPIAILSAYDDDEVSVEALKLGAFDFLNKPVDNKKLKLLITKMNTAAIKNQENIKLSKREKCDETKELIGNSDVICNLKNKIKKIAKGQAPVFIYGESGVGKEVVASIIHKLSNRSEGPFVAINCGAIPADLIESQLFGYKKGSFTGATCDSLGLIRAASGGTLFLDEVAELPLEVQVKLLRVLQEKSVRPLGSDKETVVDFRVVSATHRDLKDLIKTGAFRHDLYFRLFVMDINIPALRDRGEDILLLAENFCQRICDQWGIDNKSITPEVKDWLMKQPFNGNVRELQNIMERAITLSENDQIELVDVSEIYAVEENNQYIDLNKEELSQASIVTAGKVYKPDQESIDDYLGEIEKKILLQVLDETTGNKTLAAKKLGITFRSIRYRLKKFGIETDDDVAENSVA